MTPSRLAPVAAVSILVALLGCGPERYAYVPVRTTSAEALEPAAGVYALPPEARRGDIRVTASGITSLRPEGLSDTTLRALRVRLVVTNGSDDPWIVDGGEQQLELRGQAVGATTDRVTKPLQLTVPPRSTRSIDLFFPLPGAIAERDLRAFGLSWTVHLGARVITGRTPFERSSVPLASPAPAVSAPDYTLEVEPPLPGSEPPNRRGPMP